MKHRAHPNSFVSSRGACAGIALVECMVYIAVVTIVVGMGAVLFSKMISLNRDLQRNADDIIRALRVGEQWRADIRQATGALTVYKEEEAQVLSIPVDEHQILYRFHQQKLWRNADPTSSTRPILTELDRCEFVEDSRDQVEAWRWDFKLKTKKRTVGIEPLFSFLAVPQYIQTTEP